MAALVVAIRLTSRGPGIFRQQRVGKHGRVFTMFKLRSMRVDAECRSGAIWATLDDPRTTPVGKLLRKFHLDELPQLFNVLRGEMSLVGPRPERPEFVRVLTAALPHYRDRVLVAPGITGLAQIDLPPDSDLDSVARKLAVDLEYIETGSLWLDLRLLLCTILRVVKIGEFLWPQLFGVERNLKDHPKYVAPEASHVKPMSAPFSASELADQLADNLGDPIDGKIEEALDNTIDDSALLESSGNANGDNTGGNGKHTAGRTRHFSPGFHQHPR